MYLSKISKIGASNKKCMHIRMSKIRKLVPCYSTEASKERAET